MNAYIQSAGAGSSTSASANTHTPNDNAPAPTTLSLLSSLPGRLLKRVMGTGGGDSALGKSHGGKGFQDAWTPYPVRFLLSASLVSLMRGCMGVATQEHVGSNIMVALPMKTRHVAPPTAAAEDGEAKEGEEEGEEGEEEGEEGEKGNWEGVEEEGMEEAMAWVEMKWSTREVVEGKRALVVDGDGVRAEATVTALRYLGVHAAVAGTQEEATRRILGRQPEAAWRFAEKRMGEARRRAKRGKGKGEGAGEGGGEKVGEGRGEAEAKGEEVGVSRKSEEEEKEEQEEQAERAEQAEQKEQKQQEEQKEQKEQEEQEEQVEEEEEEIEGPWDVVFVEADAFSSGGNPKPRISSTDAGAPCKPANGSDAAASKSGINFGRRIKFDHRSLVLFHSASAAARAPNSPPSPALLPHTAAGISLAPDRPGCASVSYARALAAGFADTLPQPCLVADLAQCLHALFAPIDQSDDLSDTSTNHVAPADPSSASSLAPSTPPRPKSPQFRPKSPQFRSKAALGLAKPEDAAALLKEMLSGREVMVVDDNAVNRMVARKTLQGLGAKVELVESGEKALERLSSPNAFSILLIDLHMPPGIDGYETARRIRTHYGGVAPAIAPATAELDSSQASNMTIMGASAAMATTPTRCDEAPSARLACLEAQKACSPVWIDNARSRIRQAALAVLETQQQSQHLASIVNDHMPASAKLRDRIRKWIGRGSPAPPGGPSSKSGPISMDKVKEVAKVVKLLAQNKEFVRLFWKGDVADLLLRALRRSNEVTLLAPSPDATKAELPDDSPLVKSKKSMRRLLRYCLVLGRLVTYTNLVEDPAGTKYPTMYGQPQVKSAESSFFTVYFQTPSGKENSTLVAPNLRSVRWLAAGGNGQCGRGVYSPRSSSARVHGDDAPHTMRSGETFRAANSTRYFQIPNMRTDFRA
ncbi:unnamed protein product [Closterium sp. Yama58-4]|nr:unnamed protein product [Closterium sp. Yama58-4]